MSLHPVASHSEDLLTLDVLGTATRILLDGKQTHGVFALVEIVAAPGGGLPPHVHHREEETFHVVEGEMEIVCGGHHVHLRSGDTFFAPRGIPHAPTTVGDQPARILVTITPAGFERFFRTVDEMQGLGEATQERVEALLRDEYGCEFVGATAPPPA